MDQKILTPGLTGLTIDFASASAWVRAAHGRSRLRQAWDMLRLSRGPQKIVPRDYYTLGLFRAEITPARRREYQSRSTATRMNLALVPPELATHRSLSADKVLSQLVLSGGGFPTARTLAVASAAQSWRSLRMLPDAAAIAAFLREEPLPVFGKPVHGTYGLGAISLVSRSGDGAQLRLGDGREAGTEALAAEIAAGYPQGYMFQELLRQRPEVEALTGPAAGTLRLTTLQLDAGPALLYAIFKIPGPNAMTDGRASGGNGVALVDPATGRILRAQELTRLNTTPQERSGATGAPLAGAVLPDMAEAVAMVLDAHRMFPDHGIVGWDVILSDRGPLIGEMNTNPLHWAYQRAADRGLLNPGFAPLLAEAQARIDARLAAARRAAKGLMGKDRA